MPTTCSRCGVTSEIREAFCERSKSFRRIGETLCPQCFHKSQLATFKWLFLSKFIYGGLGLFMVLAFRDQDADWGWLLLNLFFLEMFLVMFVLPHELGHACAARLAGLRVFKLYVGSGRRLFAMKLFGFETEFRAIPLGGLTVAIHKDKRWFRLKQFAYVVAGPAVNALLAISAFGIMGDFELWDPAKFGQGIELGQVFIGANLLIVLTNLWPHQIDTPMGKHASDGKSLWNTLFLNREAIDNNHSSWFLLEGVTCQEQGQFANALSWYERGLELYPDHLFLLTLRATVVTELGRFEEARDCYLKLLARDLKGAFRATMLNNIAYVDALLGGAELLAEADRYSREALANLGWVPAVKGTRGTVLLELGCVEEALPLLRESMDQADQASGKAQNACLISIAESRRGRLSESEKYLDEAKRLMPGCMLLQHAEAELTKALNESMCPQ
jgi:hypothetical protein